MKHNICGYIYPISPGKFLQGRRCPKCKKRLRRNTEMFKNEVSDLVGEEYTVLGEFVGVETKVEIRHNKCGYVYPSSPKHFLFSNSRCPKCFGKIKWTNSHFVACVYDEVGSEYTFLEEYNGYDEHLLVQHTLCGDKYHVTPNKFLTSKTRCPKCVNKHNHDLQRKTNEEIEREILERFGEDFTLKSDYKGAFAEIIVTHKQCQMDITYTNAKNFLVGAGFCPHCDTGLKVSRGIKEIQKFFKKYNITTMTEYTIKSCMYKRQLYFDIAIFDKENLVCLIEYDGQQHFKSIPIFGGDERYIESRIKDQIKNKFCEDNNIPFIRIAFDQMKELEKMLLKFFSELGLGYIFLQNSNIK